MSFAGNEPGEWKLITEYTVEKYKCGLRAGDSVRLKRDLAITQNGRVIQTLPQGGIWKVLPGSKDDPGALWLLQPDGERHVWVDDESVFELFERVQREGRDEEPR